MIFPYDFGFIPSTKADDGDPLDVLLLLDDPAPMGCIVRVRAIGAIEAEQREDGGAWVPQRPPDRGRNPKLLDEMEAFFRNYNESRGIDSAFWIVTARKTALKLVEASRQ